MTREELPYIERYRYTWIQQPDGLYYGPRYPGEDAQRIRLEERGTLGMAPCGVGSLATSCGSPRRTTLDGVADRAWSPGMGLASA